MVTTIKKLRRSVIGTEYQIEYTHAKGSKQGEYRVRRGGYGTWTPWIQTRDIYTELSALGFAKRKPTLLNDFAFEALFGRGEIILTNAMVFRLASTIWSSARSRHLYSRAKQISEAHWMIPASAVSDSEMYARLHEVISGNL